MGSAKVKIESVDQGQSLDVDDEDAEEAIETLLNELDYWKEGGEDVIHSENYLRRSGIRELGDACMTLAEVYRR